MSNSINIFIIQAPEGASCFYFTFFCITILFYCSSIIRPIFFYCLWASSFQQYFLFIWKFWRGPKTDRVRLNSWAFLSLESKALPIYRSYEDYVINMTRLSITPWPGCSILTHESLGVFFLLLLATRFPPTGPSASFPRRLASNDWS